MICIRRPPRLDKVPEAERFSSEDAGARTRPARQRRRISSRTPIRSLTISSQTGAPGDVILVMSNGGFDNIHERLLRAYSMHAHRFQPTPGTQPAP